MIIKTLYTKMALRCVMFFMFLAVTSPAIAQAGNIAFADDAVKAICVANWDTNGDGELSCAEAAAVTDLDGVFSGNEEITSFDELQYFTGLTVIEEDAFNDCSGLTSITIPNSVQEIDNSAFEGCTSLTSITIPNSVQEIDNFAFGRCTSLLSITIPNSVTSIGDYAFYYCSGLSGSLTIPNSVTTIGDYAFAGCSGLTGSLTIPNSVTSIGEGAFAYCSGLSGSLTIPNSVTTIGSWAFYYCDGLTGSLIIGNSVTSIGEGAFEYCSGLSGSLTLGNSLAVLNMACFVGTDFSSISVDSNNPFYYSEGNAVISRSDKMLVVGCKNTIIPNDVSAIGDYAFAECSGLTGSLTIPNSVTSIGEGAFAYCSGLSGSLTLGNSLAVLNMACFVGTDFSSISVDSNNPFYYSEGNAVIGRSDKMLVLGCKNTSIPNDVNAIGNYAFVECYGLSGSLTIPNSVTSIGVGAFAYCSGLSGSLTIPNSVTTIGDYAFAECSGLTGSLTIPNSVTSIGEGAFEYCSGLSGSLTIPNSVTTIGSWAFLQCTGFTGSLTIPNSVTSIGYAAFENCSGFTGSLTIGSSVTSIGDRAFCWCGNLESINVKLLTPLPIEEYVFCGIDKSIPVYVPFGTIDAYTSAEGWREFTNFNDQAVFYSIAVSASPTEGGGVLGCYDDQFFVGSLGVDTESLMGSLEVTYGTSGSAEVMGGSRIVLIARANTGWDFVGWKENDEIVSYESVFSFIITDDRNIEAVFEQCTNCLEPELLSGRFSVSGCTAISFARSNTFMSVDPLTLYGAIEGVTEFDEEMSEQMMAQFLQTGLTLPMEAGLLFGGIELPGINYVIGEHQWDRMAYDASTLNGNNSAYNELLLTGVDVFPSFILRGNIDCWHIPTWREWDYLINQRVTESGIRFAYGTVNEVCGLILLPDDWQVSTFALTHANEIGNYDNNVITASTWTEVLEPAGAVFLPANGFMTQGTLTQSLDGQPVGAYPGLLISPNEELAGIPMTGSSSLYVDELIMLGYIQDLSNGGTSLRLAKVTDTSTATITLASNDSEQGSVAGAGEFACQQNCTITAVANEGYVFMYWLENGEAVSNDPTYSFQLLCDRNFTAVFAPEVDVCQLNLEVTSMNFVEMKSYGMGVSVTIDDKTFILPFGSVPDYLDLLSLAQMMTMTGNEEVVTYTINVPRESNVAIDLFIPDFVNNLMSAAGGSIENLATYSVSYVDGGFVVENSSEFPFEFTSNCYNMVSAVPNNTEYGTINGETSFEREFYYGESCTLTASANEGYAFVSWTEDGETVSMESEYTFTVTNNRNLIANFIPTHTISYIVDPSESGFVSNNNTCFNFENGIIPDGWNNDVSAYPWTIWNSNPHEGGYCLASNNYHTNISESFVEFTVEYATNGSIDFFSRISSESVSYDYGIFYIDGVEQYREGGTGNTWTNRHFEVTAGPHVFRWYYRKDGSVHAGEDRYFIDDITLQGVGHGDVFTLGETCTLTATPATGYHFVNWTENGEVVSTESNYSFVVTGDRDLVANFALNYYDIVAVADPEEGGVVTGGGNYGHGSECTLTAIPNEGYVFSSWTENGQTVSTDAVYDFTVTDGRSLVAVFLPTYVIFAEVNDENYGTVSGTGTYAYGTMVTLSATPADGYAFVNWTENGEIVSLESEYTFTVTNNRNLIANFIPTHTISYIVNPYESGFVSNNSTPVIVCFNFENGIIPDGWNNDVSAYPWTIWNSNPHEGGYCLASNNYHTNISESFVEFTVEYATNGSIDFFSRISSNYIYDHGIFFDYGTFYIDGVEQYCEGGTGNTWTNRHFEVTAGTHVFRWYYRKDSNFHSGEDRYFIDDITLQGVGHGDVFTLGETCTLTATPATGYHFVNWTENGEVVSTESNFSFVVAGDRDLVANFALNYYDIVAVADPEEGGVVTGGGNYGHGSECTLTAIPNEGYVFVSWQEDGEVVSEDTSYTFEVVGERHLVAVFALKYTISAAAVPTEGGMIDIFEELTVCDDLSTNEYVPFYGLYADAFLKTEFIIPAEQLVMMDGRRVTRMKFYASTANASFVNANFKVFLKEVDDTTIDAFTGYDDAIVVYQGAISVTDNTMTIPFCAPYTYHGGNLLVGFYNESQGFCVGCYFYGQNASGASVQGHSYNSLNAVEPTQCDFLPKTTFTYDKELVYLVGSLCSMTAIPYPGYAFSQWTENGMTVSTDPTYSFVVESNRTLEAHFTDHHEMELNTGWNWVSSFVDLSDSGLSMVEDALGGNGQIIKSQRDGFVMRSNGNWYGNLTGLQNQYMYRLQTSAPVNMALYAPVLNPSEVTVSLLNGWNWIGYPLSYGLNVNSALVNLNPTENDMLKSNGHFAVFDGTEWFGALQTMSPGEGYMYYASQPQSFTYAADGFTMRSVELEPKHYWQTNVHVCPDNMTVMAVVAVNGTELRESAMELGAFCQGRNVGSVRLRYNASRDRYYAPLLVSANEGDVVVFKLYDVESGCEFIGEAEEMLNFSADAMNGSLDDPMVLHFGLTNSVAEENAQMLEAYPNPVNKGGEIWLNLSDSDCPADVEIYDMLGVMVDKRQLTSNHFVLSDNLAPAAYFIKIYTSDGHLHSGKLIVK